MICVLAEWLVRRLLLMFGVIGAGVVRRCIHLGVHGWLVNGHTLRRLHNLLRLCRNIAYSAHSTLKANIIHLIYWLACLLDDAQMTVLIHSGNFTLESVHEVGGLRRLPR